MELADVLLGLGEHLLGGLGEHLRETREYPWAQHLLGGLGQRTLGAVEDGGSSGGCSIGA
jgi:hypothetical protein